MSPTPTPTPTSLTAPPRPASVRAPAWPTRMGERLDPQVLRSVRLLQGLGDEVLADVAAVARVRHFRQRQQVISRDDVDRDCFFVISGRLRVVAWSINGRELSFRDVGCGETFGELAALDGRPRSASVLALTHGSLARIDPDDLAELLRRHWCITERLLQHLAGTARDMTARLTEIGLMSVTQRLAAELLRQAATSGCAEAARRLEPEPRQSELAARIGSVREQVNRAMAELEAQGLVKRDPQGLTLPDPKALARWAESPSRTDAPTPQRGT